MEAFASRGVLCCLRGVTILTLAYLCAGELLPLPIIKASKLLQDWDVQEVLLLAVFSCLAALLASTSSSASGCSPVQPMSVTVLLATLNCVPMSAAIVALHWFSLSDNCPVTPEKACTILGTVLDVVGLVSARLARLDLGICLLLATRGESAWLLGVTGDWLGYAEAIPLHQTAGRWCAGQSALHSVAYLLFYLEADGLASLWLNCLPAPLPNGKLNRLGLVNFLGLLALAVLLVLMLSAIPQFRRRCYHVFQRLHLPVAVVFVACCALHDLPILLFAVPGVVNWCIEWRGAGTSGCYLDGSSGRSCSTRRLRAKARLLPGTSGPWAELTIDQAVGLSGAPRGQWVSLRVEPLGREHHPLSVAVAGSGDGSGDTAALTLVVSAQAGDWTRALVGLAESPTRSFEVDVAGPYPFGGGGWSLSEECSDGSQEPPLLLVAGGTGVTGWLPALASAGANGRRCHLVWCVQNEADYRALSGWLPSHHGIEVTIHITRAAAADGPLLSSPLTQPANAESATRASSRSRQGSSLAWLSLTVTLVGLVVGYWGCRYVLAMLDLPRVPPEVGWLHQTLAGYTLTRRCLPIILIAVSMVVATAVCGRILPHLLACVPTRATCPTDTELGTVTPHQTQQALLSSVPSVQVQQQQQRCEGDVAFATRHDVRAGRPDLHALVRAAVRGAVTQRLLVAACGPATLVESARKAVVAARRESPGVHVEFCGSDSRW